MSVAWAVGAFILVLTPIILIHELGHFLTARYFNIKVDEFGLGFPPRAAKLFTHKGTDFTLNWIPLGGFVRPAGEDDPTVEGGLAASSRWARFVVLSGGATANFILAIIVFWVGFALVGLPIFDEGKVSVNDVEPGSPADMVGLQAGDVLLEINGTELNGDISLAQLTVRANAGEEIPLLIERNGTELTVLVRPRLPEELADGQGSIGINLGNPVTGERERQGPVDALISSVQSCWNVVYLTISAPAMLIRGQLTPAEVRPVSPVGISQIAGRTAEMTATTGDWFPLLNLIAVINVALGFTNLLPLPALDGGRILFVLIEAVRGRRIEPEREGMVHIVGMLVLLGLMAILIVQDIVNPIF
ncbi:MAG: site-2 protease family protein [Anaerolineales bacterium]|nr:site-2 protease family protein [Anaerolineales bacterium]MCB0011516.1 site-2 protease family protein [Anaerolineales bacterium]MCB0030936.1 site-2 protease family protein [Anaerolineales bacterium]MCB8962645.1 site-2 protease family protein [Ardenticatenales bacterium]